MRVVHRMTARGDLPRQSRRRDSLLDVGIGLVGHVLLVCSLGEQGPEQVCRASLVKRLLTPTTKSRQGKYEAGGSTVQASRPNLRVLGSH